MFYSIVAILVLHTIYSSAKWNSRSHCSVYNNQLYAHGIYIRLLNEDEKAEEARYKSQMNFYKEELKKICAINENELLKRPMIPPLPSFCHSYDTTKFVLPGCSVLNDRVYADGHFVRKLNISETYALKEFMIQSKHYEVYVRNKQKQDARMEPAANLVVVEQPKAPNVCDHQENRPNLLLNAFVSVAYTYIDIFKIENVDNCNVRNGTNLYSGSIYIRHLNAIEQLEEQSYQAALKSWHEASVEFTKIFKQNNGTAPENFTWPFVPESRSFCFAYDVTQYNLTNCIVMDNIAYINDTKPQHLNDEQIKQIVDYAHKLEAYGIYLYENAMQKRGKSIRTPLATVKEPEKPTSICDEMISNKTNRASNVTS